MGESFAEWAVDRPMNRAYRPRPRPDGEAAWGVGGMGGKRSTGRAGGRRAGAAGRPGEDPVVKLTVRMPSGTRWRLRSYAADQRTTADALVRRMIEREIAGWYTARREPPPAAGRADGPEQPPADPPVRLVAPGEEAA